MRYQFVAVIGWVCSFGCVFGWSVGTQQNEHPTIPAFRSQRIALYAHPHGFGRDA
jgi:hypothetical protein